MSQFIMIVTTHVLNKYSGTVYWKQRLRDDIIVNNTFTCIS